MIFPSDFAQASELRAGSLWGNNAAKFIRENGLNESDSNIERALNETESSDLKAMKGKEALSSSYDSIRSHAYLATLDSLRMQPRK